MIVEFDRNYPEQMGLFGLSWQEKVAKFVKKHLKGTAVAKKLSSFFQAGGLNVSLINNMHNEYMALMAQGYNPILFDVQPDEKGYGGVMNKSAHALASRISNKTNIDASIILPFLRAIFVLARDGEIPFSKWNPEGFKESTALRKTFESEKGILEIAKKTGDTAKLVLLIAGLGVGAYFLSQLKFLNIKRS